MKRKIFFILSSLSAGGAERVFWLLSQGFDKKMYDVSIVLLNPNKKCFSNELEGVTIIDLGTTKASLSFFKLRKLLRRERPDTVFSTVDHINILVALVSFFVSVPNLIARASNIPSQIRKYRGSKARFYNFFTRFCYARFDKVVCQSEEMEQSVRTEFRVRSNKLVVIPNPVIFTDIKGIGNLKATAKKLILVARLSPEKGISRLLHILHSLPDHYSLTIVGDGALRSDTEERLRSLNLQNRVRLLGQQSNVVGLIAQHDLLVLSSFTEGFPNVVLEALSVGIPVVAFKVGGISRIIRDDFNGFMLEQDDVQGFKNAIVAACSKKWDATAIKNDVFEQCALDKITDRYESLMTHN
ncbi:glycosyltransferase [Desertivirga xinjiangensis]|uniref:glycosyltransferase n=1 Tax=Desertivirga xinjiangensis TaxID=539206 RepID=UPI00210E913E|nr:glycosyltransferase [Pedobacter xinjiangensis]